MMIDQELLAVFKAEVEDQIDDLCRRLSSVPSKWKLDKLFHLSHNIKGAARVVGVDAVRDAAHALEDLFVAIRAGVVDVGSVADLARAGGDLLEGAFVAMDSGETPDIASYREQVVAKVQGAGSSSPQGEGAEATGISQPVAAAGAGDDSDDEGKGGKRGSVHEETLRVGVERLDALMGLATEFVAEVFRAEEREELARRLVIHIANVLRRHPELKNDADMNEIVTRSRVLRQRLLEGGERAGRISEQLQSSVRELRMVRIESLASVLSRSLREATRIAGSQARLEILGGQTEVDRAVLVHLRDPLTHLIRNAVSHGIEPPDERRAKGKPEVGKVTVEARSIGSWVEVVVHDDGRGIDPEKIREHAVRMGIATQQDLASLSDDRIFDLLSQPGFSTASSVNELAGRGVGLDVVRDSLARIGGGVSISSLVEEGTRIVLRVPLTLLTTLAVMLRVGTQRFAVPIADVERTLFVSRQEITTLDGVEVVSIEGGFTPVADLGEVLRIPSEAPDLASCVVVFDGSKRRALLVDEVIGEREIIVQPLSWNLLGAVGLAGTTVVEGELVVAVLDSHALIRSDRGGVGASRSQAERAEVSQRRILVVDDSVTTRTLETSILRAAGYEVFNAVDGIEALATLATHPVDLVVADVRMPRMDGLELTRSIRDNKAIRDLPVVLVTGLGEEADRRRGAEAGADAYIVKGEFDQAELLRVVARLIP
jgi:two-component system chemotaxis sensor kinase CheA